MWNRAGDEAQTFNRAARFSRKRDDQRKIDKRRQAARENRVRGDLHRFRARHFAEAGNLHAHDGANRLRRNITRADARAPRR